MSAVMIHALTRKRALITRGSAQKIGEALVAASDQSPLLVDFAGIDAVTPSFVDELLAVVESILKERGQAEASAVFLNPPTRLSEKFAAVGRAHSLDVIEGDDGSWTISAGVTPS